MVDFALTVKNAVAGLRNYPEDGLADPLSLARHAYAEMRRRCLSCRLGETKHAAFQ